MLLTPQEIRRNKPRDKIEHIYQVRIR